MDSKVITKKIREIIRPLLKENGFTEFTGRNARRYSKDTVEEITFQSFNSYVAHGVGCTTYSFAVNLYVYFKCFENNPKYESATGLVKTYGVPINKRLWKTLKQDALFHPFGDPKGPAYAKNRPEIWYVKEDRSNLDENIEDAKKVLVTDGFPWLNKMTDIRIALKMIKTKPLEMEENYGGNLGSPKRMEYINGLTKFIEDSRDL